MSPLIAEQGVSIPEHLSADLMGISPALLVFAAALFIVVWEAIVRPADRRIYRSIGLATVTLALGLTFGVQAKAHGAAFSGMVRFDDYGVLFNAIFLVSAGLTLAISHDYLEQVKVRVGEYYGLALFSLFGMMMMGIANDLILLFVALEVMSLGFYVMSALRRDHQASVESGFKYFIMGAFASGLLLYGISLLFGATGTTTIDGIRDAVAAGNHGALLLTGMGLVMAGFSFKVAAVPFHMWAPDVYQGAPTPVTGYMATGVKAASFAAFGRVMFVAFLGLKEEWAIPLWLVAAATMLLGNLAALAQRDLKRMLAYSSIAHAGYVLMGVVAVDGHAVDANGQVSGILFYLFSYTFMTLGTFAVLSLMVKDGEEHTDLSSIRNLGKTHPWMAAGLTLCLLSLAGIPPTMGFVGKFYLFAAAVRGGYTSLAVIGAISGAVGVYYYLRPIVLMYMQDDEESFTLRPGPAVAGVLAISGIALLFLGLHPGDLLELCRAGVASLAG